MRSESKWYTTKNQTQKKAIMNWGTKTIYKTYGKQIAKWQK